MLEELLKYDKIGTKDELSILLFQILSSTEYKRIDDVKTICIHNSYSFGNSFKGIIQLLQSLKLIHIEGDLIKLDEIISQYQPDTFFENSFLFERLFQFLKKAEAIDSLFNYLNAKLDNESKAYYVKESQIPFKLNSIKKLLINTEFLVKRDSLKGIYFVNPIFNELFSSIIVPVNRKFTAKRVITLLQLKEILALQEKYGEEAEEFVLAFELKRLYKHPQKQEIKRISKDFVNAGFDIESFDSEDSITNDRLIEVKSYNINVNFYWTTNEIETAKELGDLYFLYLIDRSKISVTDYHPHIIKDPYKNIFLNDDWHKNSDTYFVYKK